MFFCSFNEPVYVKLEKIDILVMVADDKNVDYILSELREYSCDMDLDLVRKSVKAIGQIILKVDRGAKKAVEIIHDLVNNGQELALQEAVIVAKNIFRKFPNRFEALIKDLCTKLMSFSEPDSKAAIIWIIGEYAEKINESENLIDSFTESFVEEPDKVKLQILTATVKLYLKKPDEADDLIQKVLKLSTEECDNPDLRDRAYIYWRMLSAEPQKAKVVVLSEKPQMAEDSYNQYDDDFVDQLIEQMATLSSVYHKTPDELAAMQKKVATMTPMTGAPAKEEAKATKPVTDFDVQEDHDSESRKEKKRDKGEKKKAKKRDKEDIEEEEEKKPSKIKKKK